MNDEMLENIKEKLKTMPFFITELEDGSYEVVTKSGKKYTLRELSGDDLERTQRLAKQTNVDVERLLVVRSLIEPKITDDEFGKLPGGDFTRLKLAITYVYGMNDFL